MQCPKSEEPTSSELEVLELHPSSLPITTYGAARARIGAPERTAFIIDYELVITAGARMIPHSSDLGRLDVRQLHNSACIAKLLGSPNTIASDVRIRRVFE